MSSAEEFFSMVGTYNVVYWPINVVTVVLGIAALALAWRNSNASDRIISAILAALWLWSGLVFFLGFFRDLTPTIFGFVVPGFAYVSGALFVLQAIVFLYFGVARASIGYGFDGSPYAIAGLVTIVYAIVLYPVVGHLTGHPLPGYPVFGSAPCPVSIFTVGMLLLANRRMPGIVPIVPLVWGLMGIVAVLVLTVWADLGLFASGILGLLILKRNARLPATASAGAA